MPSINDWAAKAARRILGERYKNPPTAADQDRIAAIIATFAEPLLKLLQESRRGHYHCEDDAWYCCGACTHECGNEELDHECDESCCVESGMNRTQGVCNCGADAWNARVDAALAGSRG